MTKKEGKALPEPEYLTQELTEESWQILVEKLSVLSGNKIPDLNAVLFLIGLQELGKGRKNYTKEEKQDLIHIAICKVMSFSGYYRLRGLDQEGWPDWECTKEIPFIGLKSQENLLKANILKYFNRELGW